ncbi:hypothetical protein [Rhizobium phaseoli]|uniref:hypothetical protein n=1 Tax=Rhizobium phaseoli TaxID=396 RepID=UPI002552388D|nr:hypothetical protein [Rhizobium phaseoli]MDK4730343.1 hypothetical protein [Rhizobium phaseoli]
MPIRRRSNLRRAGEVEAWCGYFQSGCDFFDELAAIGLTEATAEPLAEETWRRIGFEVIEHIENLHRNFYPPPRPFWAEENFGQPGSPGGKRRR